MKMMLNLAKAGLEAFHPQYGKLLGKNKAGLELYEQLFSGQRVLTSIKDGKVYKQVSQGIRGGSLETESRNFVNGDTVKVEKSDLTFGFTRQDGKTGSWEQLDALYAGDKPTGNIRDIDFQYINCDIPNSKVLTMKKDIGDYIDFNAVGRNQLTGQKVDYVLPDGNVIPKSTTHTMCINDQGKLERFCNTMELNLGQKISENLMDLAKRMCGIKP